MRMIVDKTFKPKWSQLKQIFTNMGLTFNYLLVTCRVKLLLSMCLCLLYHAGRSGKKFPFSDFSF